MIITITGRMGSGKDTVLNLLNAPEGYLILDADTIGHDLLTKDYVIKKVSFSYPTVIENGKINKQKLAAKVFPNNIDAFNQIIHPYLIEEIQSNLYPNTIINAAIPKELKLLELSDVIITVDSTDESIIKRTAERFERQDVLNRLKVQKTREWYNGISDIIINNNGSFEELQEEVDKKCKTLF